MNHRISSGALVENEGRLLLVRHRKEGEYDSWVAPGGGVQGSESLAAAAEREVREESGLEVVAERLVYVEEFHNPETRHCKFWFIARLLGVTLVRLRRQKLSASTSSRPVGTAKTRFNPCKSFPRCYMGGTGKTGWPAFPGFIIWGCAKWRSGS